MILGVVADDLTGAGDIAGMTAQAGYLSVVQPSSPPPGPLFTSEAVSVLDTDSRFDPPGAAYDKVFAATRAPVGCRRRTGLDRLVVAGGTRRPRSAARWGCGGSGSGASSASAPPRCSPTHRRTRRSLPYSSRAASAPRTFWPKRFATSRRPLMSSARAARAASPYPELERLTARYPVLSPCLADLERAFETLRDAFAGGGKLLLCGSGGSAADSEHIVGELMKGFKRARPLPEGVRGRLEAAFPAEGPALAAQLQGALPALSLVSQTALLSAVANDVGAELVYAQQVYGYGRPGDALLGISTSGTSTNVLHALRVARAQGLRTLGLTGRSGGAMRGLCDVTVCVPADDTLEIQELHLPVYHALCELLEVTFFP